MYFDQWNKSTSGVVIIKPQSVDDFNSAIGFV